MSLLLFIPTKLLLRFPSLLAAVAGVVAFVMAPASFDLLAAAVVDAGAGCVIAVPCAVCVALAGVLGRCGFALAAANDVCSTSAVVLLVA